jgi:hypothetical protein
LGRFERGKAQTRLLEGFENAEKAPAVLSDKFNAGLVNEFRAVSKDGVVNLAVDSLEDDAVAVSHGAVNLK